ncbi:hypothetical protein MSG28_003997 [Choristoneura fumiferana]|uniref:Uncharacterized protein n=1 Tax=Choristoneura fumiferana TaxID=7141 RepID=A0ACC0KH67_CHOFU|nr:hypothetical protein MSG28_003997 [Choristoneura fumiferana]
MDIRRVKCWCGDVVAAESFAEGLEGGAEGEAEAAGGGDEGKVGRGGVRLVVHPALEAAAEGGGVGAEMLEYLFAERLGRIAQHLGHGLY